MSKKKNQAEIAEETYRASVEEAPAEPEEQIASQTNQNETETEQVADMTDKIFIEKITEIANLIVHDFHVYCTEHLDIDARKYKIIQLLNDLKASGFATKTRAYFTDTKAEVGFWTSTASMVNYLPDVSFVLALVDTDDSES